jgi:NAD(P)-dependent dehydrogenase (short-subunit alcohol dehydrogenase family)
MPDLTGKIIVLTGGADGIALPTDVSVGEALRVAINAVMARFGRIEAVHIHPLGACPHGDVVANALAFLLSNKTRFLTGCILPVSGGAELDYRR